MDPIADMLSLIKNAALVKKETVLVPYSQIKFEIANILKERGYILLGERRGRKNRKFLELGLAYEPDGSPRLHDAKRISKPSRRIYRKVAEIRPVRRGYGLAVISTPKGLKSDAAARRERVGGEIICEIW
ncbi:MAG: 30S ribosomal protein S8 [Patescibacteria group bacterium]